MKRPAKKTAKKSAAKPRKVTEKTTAALSASAQIAGALVLMNKATAVVCASKHFTGDQGDAAELIFRVIEVVGRDPALVALVNPMA